MSAVVAFRAKVGGAFTLEHFSKAFDLYTTDLLFTLAIVLLSTVLIGLLSIAIAGYLTLGENPRAVALLVRSFIHCRATVAKSTASARLC